MIVMGDATKNIPRDPPGILDDTDRRLWSGGAGSRTVDDYFLDLAIDLAWLGAGKTQPNPLVGAVAVKEGKILGVGYHPHYGEEHAETIALERAGDAARGCTLYVTLEPCAHHGNTPPCVDQLIAAGVSRVVIPTLDPDKRVNGEGVRVLRESGIRVDVGARADRALLLNLAYFKSKLDLAPAVTLKMAVTLDGKIASGPGRRDDITGIESRRMVHRLRAVHDGVLIGIDTVEIDSPQLDCRLLEGVRPPVPVVIDPALKFPEGHAWLAGRRPVIITTQGSSEASEKALTRGGARVVRCAGTPTSIDLAGAARELHALGISSVLVEGGRKVFSSFVDAGVWDGMFLFVSPAVFGPRGVELADRAIDRAGVGAVFAGALSHAGDIALTFINENSRRALLARLW
jgi:diaminohydroxyphosphoribosylaminopyrimidine deaminase/5-amino-6-(5-phosphoribosylamino)uracil reductase